MHVRQNAEELSGLRIRSCQGNGFLLWRDDDQPRAYNRYRGYSTLNRVSFLWLGNSPSSYISPLNYYWPFSGCVQNGTCHLDQFIRRI